MNTKPKESDWKQFRDQVAFLRERYLKEKNQQLLEMLTDSERTPTAQFWEYDLIAKYVEKLFAPVG